MDEFCLILCRENELMPSHRERANALRALAMDAVQKANSGHPGMPMGMADIAEVLWTQFLKFNPKNPKWLNRDRFVLSNGHGVMLQYALLHLSGFDLSIDDLKAFRQWGSLTPGHPEHNHTPGIETTTGPLGQGLATAVGMAMAEKQLAGTFNRANFELVNHYTYVFVGDGDLMEGISHEACSLAGTWGLSKLIVLYDDNGISIDGPVQGWFSEDIPARFESYGWHVIPKVDGHDPQAITQAIESAKKETTRPTMICCQTIIGYGAPALAGQAVTHGAPLGEHEIEAARKLLKWNHPPFVIPKEIYTDWDASSRGALLEREWQSLFDEYKKNYPELAKEFIRRQSGELPETWKHFSQQLQNEMRMKEGDTATRKLSLSCIDHFVHTVPELIGGSCDLSESNGTLSGAAQIVQQEHDKHDASVGNYIHYGVREFAMSAIMNGLSLHGGFIPFGGTFLVFSDYARPAVRLAALMQAHVIFVYTHDSIGLGEDGPTHQPIEQLAALRLIPGLSVWRPFDALETLIAWQTAIENKKPHCLVLTRQAIPRIKNNEASAKEIARGGYILWEPKRSPIALLIATGSEVALALKAAECLAEESIHVRVISMPCYEVFKAQSPDYQATILPPDIKKRMVIEAGVTDTWYSLVGDDGLVFGIDQFGASAPGQVIFEQYGLTEKRIVKVLREKLLKKSKK